VKQASKVGLPLRIINGVVSVFETYREAVRSPKIPDLGRLETLPCVQLPEPLD